MVGFNTYRFGFENSPFADLERMSREFQHLVGGLETEARHSLPVNLEASDDEAVVTVEVPGVETSDIDLQVENQTLTIRVERKAEECGEVDRFHRRERAHGKMARLINLPYEVEVEQVRAQARQGVLTIRLPRSAATRPRKISVNTN